MVVGFSWGVEKEQSTLVVGWSSDGVLFFLSMAMLGFTFDADRVVCMRVMVMMMDGANWFCFILSEWRKGKKKREKSRILFVFFCVCSFGGFRDGSYWDLAVLLISISWLEWKHRAFLLSSNSWLFLGEICGHFRWVLWVQISIVFVCNPFLFSENWILFVLFFFFLMFGRYYYCWELLDSR